MPTLPFDQVASTFCPVLLNPLALPFNQSMTAFPANASDLSPTVGQPVE